MLAEPHARPRRHIGDGGQSAGIHNHRGPVFKRGVQEGRCSRRIARTNREGLDPPRGRHHFRMRGDNQLRDLILTEVTYHPGSRRESGRRR